jgi:peptide deformylase
MNTTDDIILYDTAAVSKVEPSEPSIKTYELVPSHWPTLFQVLPEFDFSAPPINPIELASSLVETCRKYNGYGLSANQCGFTHRVFVMGTGDEYVAYFNPKLISTEGEIHMEEGCLSIPYLMLNLTRPKKVMVEYQDYNGTKREATFDGITARCFLHELDHMNGILYTSKVKPLALQFGLKKMQKMYQKISKQMRMIARTKSKK